MMATTYGPPPWPIDYNYHPASYPTLLPATLDAPYYGYDEEYEDWTWDIDEGVIRLLIIDKREPEKIRHALTSYFESLDIEVRVKRMEFGDFVFELEDDQGTPRTIIIERKTPSDFIQSTIPAPKSPETKMARQLNGCIATGADVVVLLIDGQWYPLKGGKIKTSGLTLSHNPNAFSSKLRTIMNRGIRVEHNQQQWYLPQFLHGLMKYEMKSEHNTLALTPRAFTVPKREDVKWTVLVGIKGVGPVMAKEILAEFGSVQNIANADSEQLRKVKGVGRVTAENIIWHLT